MDFLRTQNKKIWALQGSMLPTKISPPEIVIFKEEEGSIEPALEGGWDGSELDHPLLIQLAGI